MKKHEKEDNQNKLIKQADKLQEVKDAEREKLLVLELELKEYKYQNIELSKSLDLLNLEINVISR